MQLRLFRHWTYQILSPGTVVREKYDAFKQLLEHDKQSHELLAELEDIYYNFKKVDLKAIENKYDSLSQAVAAMVENLIAMAPGAYDNLLAYYKKIDFYIRFNLHPLDVVAAPPFTMALDAVGDDARDQVGGKAFNLALLKQKLALPVPEGFVVTTNAFHHFIEHNNLRPQIDQHLARLDNTAPELLDAVSRELVRLIDGGRIPADLEKAVMAAFAALKERCGATMRVALRSSAVAEDSAISFAGQYSTVLNVTEADILAAYKQVLASKYSPRALHYRIHYGLSDLMAPMAVAVIEMIDAAASGVITTADIENDAEGTLVIHSLWGLGEPLVGGETPADAIAIDKTAPLSIVRRRLAKKQQQLVALPSGENRMVPVAEDRVSVSSLADRDALTLGDWGVRIEDFYGGPQDIEWCMDNQNRLLILQARPLPLGGQKAEAVPSAEAAPERPVLLRGGERASAGAGAGRVFKVGPERPVEDVPPDAVLVVQHTLPSYARILGRVRAVVADQGSVAGHFASVAREFGIPMLVNTGTATTLLAHGEDVTVDAGALVVYAGLDESVARQQKVEPAPFLDSPYRKKLKFMIGFISPLKLVDPKDPSFVPESCRSLHDIIRFAHEMCMAEMFVISNRGGTGRLGAKRLISPLPLTVFVLDVGNGLDSAAKDRRDITVADIRCLPLLATWQGLTHPGLDWSSRNHFDWKSYDAIVMAGGIASRESTAFASYAVVSGDYLNLNMRFGYHFTILDTICSPRAADNYITLRFAGGGGDFSGRSLRIRFLAAILERLGFAVDIKGDLLDARSMQDEQKKAEEKLDLMGRLLGATRLLDMVLREDAMVERFVEDFFAGRYDFSSANESPENG